MEEAVVQLEAELERNPGRADGWQLLARSYEMLGRRVEARDAYARALVLAPDDPDLLVQAAQARLFADPDKKLDAEAVAMLKRSLELQRSEEHTSELQSLMRISYAVFCLKKKKQTTQTLTKQITLSTTYNNQII